MDTSEPGLNLGLSSETLESEVNGDSSGTLGMTVDTGQQHPCDKCGQCLPKGTLLSSHQCQIPSLMVQVGGPGKVRQLGYRCPLCKCAFALAGALKQHFRTHRSEPRELARCPEQSCTFSSMDRQTYRRHLSTVHGLQPVLCPQRFCRLAFRTEAEMEEHRRIHFPFRCTRCPFVTTSARRLNEHGCGHRSPSTSREGEDRAVDLGQPGGAEEEDPQQSSERRGQKQPVGPAAHTDDPMDHHLKSHIAEGTEHMYRTHMCPECRRCFKKRTHLLEHLHLHFPDPSLQCPTCRHHFTSKSKLRIHMLREAGQKPHRCHLCAYSAVERNSLRRHLASVHAEEGGVASSDVYPCPICGEAFHQSQALKAHMKVHWALPAGRQPLACFWEGCPFRGADRRALQRHVRESHGVEAVQCPHHACGAFFGSQDDMQAHRRTHLPFHCPHCDFSCSNKGSFQRHKRQGHAGETELCCTFCPFVTFNPVQFEEHMGRLHANEKTHRCPECDFITAHKRVLGRHLLLHTGEKPHKCKLCDFRCRDETYLSKHMLTHSDNKNHMCSECGYVTKWKHYLSVHMRKHAGDLRYQCDQCPYRCHRSDQLSSHKLRHQDKSLICEVCAFSCKRKYELRRHMQLKHGAGELRAALFQCRYCPYSTHYRQALHNHENCRHTRHRQFQCALCAYVTFSSTSLFLHKRKVHGYVPGDRAWLENYAKKERENSSAAGSSWGSFAEKQAEDILGNQETCSEGGGASGQLESSLWNVGRSNENDQTAAVEDRKAKVVKEGTGLENEISTVAGCHRGPITDDDDNDEECCTLVLTSIPHPENTAETCLQEDFESAERSSSETQFHPKMFLTEVGSPMCFPRRPSEDEQKGAPVAASGGQSDGEGRIVPTTEANVSDQSAGAVAELFHPEAQLTALRRRDKEQAEALVLEGRVQMLLVHAKARVHGCDHCTFATHSPTALAQHCRMSCRARRVALRCTDCGAAYKQQRGLDTHRLRKCPVLLKKTRRQIVPAANGQPGIPEAQTQDLGKLDQPQAGSQDRLTGIPSPEPVTEELECRNKESSMFDIHRHPSGQRQATGRKMGLEEVNSAAVTPGMTETRGYSRDDGGFKCRTCPFSSHRLTTTEQHSGTCTRRPLLEAAGQMSNMPEGNKGGDDCVAQGGNDEDRQNEGREVRQDEKSMGLRFFCSSCPFTCHQQRALDSHRRRGCLKPSDIQCRSCSFVAKSQESLKRHALVHSGRQLATLPQGQTAQLRCRLCPFTCKQARCLAQHVALKHEGARPHHCRFCTFSTTRRYRLDAHESLHTGVGRLACRLCGRTFGTASKLRLHQQRVHDRQPTHFCSLCDYSGYGPNDVARHTHSCHTGVLEHTCDRCTACFSSDAALKQHRRRQHQDPGSLPCPHCDFMGRSQGTLAAHLRQQHPRLECNTCHEKFPSQQALEDHRRTHLSQRCPACPFAARGRQQLAQHLLDEHEDGPLEDKLLKCAACGFTCRHQLVFEQHVRSHGGARLYRCTDCQYSTRNRQKITWHIRIHTGEKPYRCEVCHYSCADPSRLKYHKRIHQEERKYLCPECGYKCKWVNQLKYHMTKHTGAKPYACEECEYRTNRADALRVHRETRHRDTRSFICEKCGKGFKTRFLLRTHQRRHSEARPYVCRLCRRSFRWPAGLRHHFLTHTERQPFFCCHCPYRARQRFQVVKHLRRHHPNEPLEQGVGREPGPHSVSLQEARLSKDEVEQPGDGPKVDQVEAAPNAIVLMS